MGWPRHQNLANGGGRPPLFWPLMMVQTPHGQPGSGLVTLDG
jgi:hypothetical protein